MIYTKMTKMALKLCFEAHKNQFDKSGMPYVFHPFHLAEQMNDEEITLIRIGGCYLATVYFLWTLKSVCGMYLCLKGV